MTAHLWVLTQLLKPTALESWGLVNSAFTHTHTHIPSPCENVTETSTCNEHFPVGNSFLLDSSTQQSCSRLTQNQTLRSFSQTKSLFCFYLSCYLWEVTGILIPIVPGDCISIGRVLSVTSAVVKYHYFIAAHNRTFMCVTSSERKSV